MKANRLMNVVLVAALLFFLLSGCKTLEDRCLERFPPVFLTEVYTDTLTDTLILPDTFVEYIDTTYCPPGLPDTLVVIKTRTVQLPGDTLINDYYCTDTVIVQRDAEQIVYLGQQVTNWTDRAKEAQKKVVRLYWIIGGILFLVGGVAFLAITGRLR